MDIYDFGERLQKLRKKRKLSQKDVAKRLNVSSDTISAYERNIQTPRLERLIELAVLYNASVDYILGFNNRKFIYLDDLPPAQQETVLKVVEVLREELKKNN